MKNSRKVRGFVMVLLAASFWGLSGTVAQHLFTAGNFQPAWLVTVRLLASGLILLVLQARKTNIFTIWRRRPVSLLLFGVFGMLAVQYTYFAAIAASNAATATLLQYLGPALLLVYVCLRLKKLPKPKEWTAVLLALFGTYLLLTNGMPQNLQVSPAAVAWGLTSAAALGFYTLFPGKLLQEWGSGLVVGWGMFIGGFFMSFVAPPWHLAGQQWTLSSVGAVLFVIVFGTLLAFFLYLESLHYILPMETSLLACAEPLVATISAILWLGVSFGAVQLVGGTFIVFTVVLLSMKEGKRKGRRGVRVKEWMTS
ncbi:MAG TPA: EamA family transporter [Bacillales bacterium]|nr:EamA family transporter [Bacillales bacterium]